MFLRTHRRKKDGKIHEYWSICESRRVAGGKVVQRHVLYLGEINSSQQRAWRKTIEAIGDDGDDLPEQLALYPEDRAPSDDGDGGSVVQIRLNELELHCPRQWGACWLTLWLWDQLRLDAFWKSRLKPSRKGTDWLCVLKTLVAYRLIDPGSEWRLHRQWFTSSAMADLLGQDFRIAQKDALYNCHDKLLEHKKPLFSHLYGRWNDLFNASYDILLYDLTSTYFESDPPEGESKRKFGYSRDKRPDCVQVVIALVITPEGFPLAYEVMPGNTSDKTTLPAFLRKIRQQYGEARRLWIMDRGIPTEEILKEMRRNKPSVFYLVGTPKGRLSKLEKHFLGKPWEEVRDQLEVKLHQEEGELFVLARSQGRFHKERSMRRRRLRKLLVRLREIRQMKGIRRDELLMKVGAARQQAGRAYRLLDIRLPKADEPITESTFRFELNRSKLRTTRRREGSYILRSNLGKKEVEAGQLWHYYMKLTEIEGVFRNLKGDLSVRPIHHQKESRIEAHIFIAFLAYCLHVTLGQRLQGLAPGLTPRSALEKMSTIQMIDVHLPTTDGRKVILPRYTRPEKDVQLLLERLRLDLPAQPPPRITKTGLAN